jgi:two-component system nitrate/nitrite response regulator NarL
MGRFCVLASVETADAAIDQASALRPPDVVLVDLPPAARNHAIATLAIANSRVRIVAIGVSETESDVVALAEAGATGYVHADGSISDLTEALDRASRGQAVCSPEVTAALMRRLSERVHPLPAGASTFTARECQVAALLMRGMSNKEIAAQLHIEVATVKNHVHHILGKLHARRRGEVVARLGLWS